MEVVRKTKSGRGFTIVELLVTMAVILLITVAAAMSLGVLFRADLKTSGGQLSASVRYLYSLSVLNNQSYRLVIDLESGEYWGEERPREGRACDVYLVDKEGDKRIPDAPTRRPKGSSDVPGEEQETATGGFEKLKDNLMRKRKLEGKIGFAGVMTSHHSDLQEDGQVEVNFFPSGYVERAFIYIGDDDTVHTIETKPLLGTAEVHRERLAPSSLFASY